MDDEQGSAPQGGGSTARVLGVVFYALCAETLFSIPYRTVFLATHSPAKSWLAAAAASVVCALIFLQRRRLRAGLLRVQFPSALLSAPVTLAAGVLLRLLWVACFHPALASDGAAYFGEASRLATQHTYDGNFWPPGFPLFLTPFFVLLGSHYYVAVLCGFLLFAATLLLARSVALRVTASVEAAALAGWIIALWPGDITAVGANLKEAWIATLLTAIAGLLYVHGARTGRKLWLAAAATGVLCGLVALTQPGFILFPACLLLAYGLLLRRFRLALLTTLVAGLAMLLTILPWTVRNYRAYGRVILISSNGGSVFYRANNPLANAAYSHTGEYVLSRDTQEADRQGYALARAWIRNHPIDFAALSLRKQVVFLGDDGEGIYESLKRNQSPNPLVYSFFKAIASLYWFLLWLGLLCLAGPMLRAASWPAWFSIAFLPFAYQWFIDSIFESGSRHHLAHVGCLALLVAAAFAALRAERTRTALS